MDGLYALKPWYAGRLAPLRARLVAHRVSPNALTLAGVLAGAGAGASLAYGPRWLALPLLAARLAFANLDGTVARESGRTGPWGSVVNELGDRLADLAALAGCFALAPAPLVLAAMLASTLPSWVALAAAAAGARRVNGGPVGKTERALLLSVVALAGHAVPALAVIAVGGLLTAALRLHTANRELSGGTR